MGNLNPNSSIGVNLAVGKPTAQSSILAPGKHRYDPQGACNGKKTGRFGFHTLKEHQPWWQIDLKGIYQVSEIKIYNRIDSCQERAASLNILFSQDTLNWELYYSNDQYHKFGGVDGNPLIVNVFQKVTRYIRLQLREKEYFHLDEVEIYGIPSRTDDSELKPNLDEATLAANFYSQGALPTSLPVKQEVIMNMLSKLRLHDTDLGKIRVGNSGDGGYVIPNDLVGIKGVVSIGIGGEVSFDKHFAEIGIKVFQYDHTVKAPPITHKNFIFNRVGWSSQDSNGFITLSKILETNGLNEGDLLLKFDVENAEWDALSNVQLELLKRFRIITCELHGFDTLKEMSVFKKVDQVIGLLTANHTVVHLHPNNCCGIELVSGIVLPRLIEFSFLRNDRASFYPSYSSVPSSLDFPNKKRKPEIVLTPFHMSFSRNIGVNLALSKPTAQSSILAPERYGYDPQGACNGKKTGGFGFHTLQEIQPWWQVDLQGTYQVSEIKVYNRIDICQERAFTLDIFLSQDAQNWELYYSNDKHHEFGGIDGNPLLVRVYQKVARYVRLQLREKEYFHLDEVEIYGTPYSSKFKPDQDEAALSANFYCQASHPSSFPPREIPAELIADFTVGNQIPVVNRYYNNTVSSPTYLSIQAYNNAFSSLENSCFKYYGNTLNYLLSAIDKYSLLGKSVLVFGLTDVNCDAISLWKGAVNVYVIDYNLPISEHPQVHVLSYEDYIDSNIQADAGISISSFEHDGLGRYGDPINPGGDLEAMKLSKKLIREGGILFFSVPVGGDCLVWNAHRIYGKIRLPMILEGWKVLDTFGFSDSLLLNQDLGQYREPIFVLKNL